MIGRPVTIRDFTTSLTRPIGFQGPAGGAMTIPAELGQMIGVMIVSDLKDRMSRSVSPNGQKYQPLGHPRPNGGDKPLLDTGILRGSLTHQVKPDSVVVGTNLKYAPLHQFGGTIIPKRAKFLSIPLTRQAKLAGSPRRMAGLSFRKTKTGGGLLIDASGIAQFVLVKSVVVPARPFIGLSDDVRRYIGQMAAEYYGSTYALRMAGGN